MKKKLFLKVPLFIFLFLLIISSVNFFNENDSNINKKIKSYKYNNLIIIPDIIPIFKLNNYYILLEENEASDNKSNVKGDISIGRPSGGD